MKSGFSRIQAVLHVIALASMCQILGFHLIFSIPSHLVLHAYKSPYVFELMYLSFWFFTF